MTVLVWLLALPAALLAWITLEAMLCRGPLSLRETSPAFVAGATSVALPLALWLWP